MFLIITIIAIYAASYITYPVIVILHELGHAFAYLLFTKPDNVDVFIGSYGDTNTRLKFKISRLHFYIKLSFPYVTRGGSCRSSKTETNYVNEIIILLAGSVFTVIAACVIGFIALNTDVHGSVKLFCIALIVCSFFSLYTNLVPNATRSAGLDNDGELLSFTIKYRKVYTAYTQACELLMREDFKAASEKLIDIATIYPKEKKFLQLLIPYLITIRNLSAAEKYLLQLMQLTELSTDEYLNLGYAQSVMGKGDQAIENYKLALAKDADNLIGLNNLSYELTLKGDFAESEGLLKKAIGVDPEFATTYNSLGFLRILTNDLEVGKQLVEKCLELEPENAYAYKHLGIYFLKIQNREAALENFDRALALDDTIDLGPFKQEAEAL